MSDAYEGVSFRSDECVARLAFDSLASPLRLRLLRLGGDVFGILRVAVRADAFDPKAVEQVAARVSAGTGRAVALFHDDSCGVRAAVLYSEGRWVGEFGDGDEWWAPLGDDGAQLVGGARLRVADLQPDEEYDCVFSAIDAGLEAIGAVPQVSAASVKQAFCCDGAELLVEK